MPPDPDASLARLTKTWEDAFVVAENAASELRIASKRATEAENRRTQAISDERNAWAALEKARKSAGLATP
jgi:hypothetical protein